MMIALKLCIILFLNFFLNVLSKSKEFQIKFDVTCGNIPVSGTVQFCTNRNKEIDTWQLDREKKVEHKVKYEVGDHEEYFYVYIRSDCGVLSKLGTYCQNEYKIEFDARRQYKTPILLEYHAINLLNEVRKIEKKTEISKKKCNEELKIFTCT
uniref:Uncharacterized protein n=1 Tax=Panagrolaimus sp. ES5 TaxID=591445 RepID=A0AC34GUL9_9BILA